MSSPVIRVENISKQYRLGQIGTGSLHHDINRWWHIARGKEDPYLKVGEVNDRSRKGNTDYVWALKDVSFDVNHGEVLGIIGRNGAGKSTLLKILSRTTTPTTGSIKMKGRVASLLEVGTGFHADLSGRENIYLNGAILGMRRKEIDQKLEEIIDFAGVERYIDTPVKRYSSGMYVRLAFAVAAHLEPEILIVDEVLAVGDAEFQKKCLGKMKDVSEQQGRTVLFVSHQMDAIASLTTQAIVLHQGKISFHGNPGDAIKEYLHANEAKDGTYTKAPEHKAPEIISVQVYTSEPGLVHKNGEDLSIAIEINMPYHVENMGLSFQVLNQKEQAVIYAYRFDVEKPLLRNTGVQRYICTLPSCELFEDSYYLNVHLAESKGKTKFETLEKICGFAVKMLDRKIEWGWQKNQCIYTAPFVWQETNPTNTQSAISKNSLIQKL